MDRLRWLYSLFGLIAVMLQFGTIACLADDISFNARWRTINSNSQTTLKTTNERIDAESFNFDQRYNLNFTKNLFPNLTFAAGSFYQINEITTTNQDLETEINQERLSPYLEMNLNNQVLKTGIAYRKTTVEEEITDLEKTTSDRDQYTAILGMTSVGLLPRWNLSYTRTTTTDKPETVDQQVDLINFTTQYAPIDNLHLDYAYNQTDTDNRLQGFSTTEKNHYGRITYDQNFFSNRMVMNSGYSINYNTLEFPATATVETPLLRSAGLSSLDTSPTDGPALVATPSLIDGNLTASAGLDIGLGGDEANLTNIGLDFGFSVDVNILRIWVDRRLSAQVANSFSWSIYTSPDNLDTSTWTLVTTVAPANFGVFENRFEMSFPTVNTRFIKVVVRPLLPSVAGANGFPNIFVTEMEALNIQIGVPVTGETTSINHNFNFNLRGRLTKKTTAGYNLYYTKRTEDPADLERDQLTNGVYLNHAFNPIFSASANFQRTDETDVDEKIVDDIYSASLRAAWFRTLNQIITYSNRSTSDDTGEASQNAVILRTNAILYQGWDAFVDVGYGWDETADGVESTNQNFKCGTNISPFDKLTFNFNYSYKQTDQKDAQEDSQVETQIDFQGFYVPFRNLSMFAKFSIIDKADASDTLQNYSINWSPFDRGDLQLFFIYSEMLRSESNQTERSFGPSARWTITRNMGLDLSYTISTTEDTVLKTESESLSAEFKLHF